MAAIDDFGTTERNEAQLADLQAQAQAPQTPTESDPGLFVRKDLLAAKGDLYIATAAAVIGRQASSASNGDVLTVDTSTTTGWKVAAISVPATAWGSWTPSWTNLTIGNATVACKYTQIGKAVFCRLSVVWGSTTSASGDPIFSLPITALAYGGSNSFTPLGNAVLFDDSAGTLYDGVVEFISTTTALFRVRTVGATYVTQTDPSATVPFTWTTSDEMNAEFFYEAA